MDIDMDLRTPGIRHQNAPERESPPRSSTRRHPGPTRPADRRGFEIAIVCALPLESEAIEALFDRFWDDGGQEFDRVPGDPNVYTAGSIGSHNIVLAHLPGMGKALAASAAGSFRVSYPNIKLALLVGICGAVPALSGTDDEVILGDVMISDGIVQYDLQRQFPGRSERKDRHLDVLGRPNAEIRALLAKLKGGRGRKKLMDKTASNLKALSSKPVLRAEYPGSQHDRRFEPTYHHLDSARTCEECGCDGPTVSSRTLLDEDTPLPAVHFGLIASGDTVMKSGEDRDKIVRRENVVAFEMEAAGLWDVFPCVVIKGAADYADSHKSKAWQRYAAATAAACAKAFLEYWGSSLQSPEAPTAPSAPDPLRFIQYARNGNFVGRKAILDRLLKEPIRSHTQSRISLFGLGGIGKTQIALEHAYRVHETHRDVSVFWVHGDSTDRFRESYSSIATECRIPAPESQEKDIPLQVKKWLEDKSRGWWQMIIDNADDLELFTMQDGLAQYIPDCSHGSILFTTRNKQAGLRLCRGRPPIEVSAMGRHDTRKLLRVNLGQADAESADLVELSERLEHLPIALAQATAFIEENTIAVRDYIRLLDKNDTYLADLLSQDFETTGKSAGTSRAVAETWIVSFEQIQRQDSLAASLLSLMSFIDRQGIPKQFLEAYCKQNDMKNFELELTGCLGLLKAFSLISEARDNTLNIHRLVQLATRTWLARKGQTAHFSGQALRAMARVYPNNDFENWETCRTWLPHVFQVLAWARNGLEDEGLARAGLLSRASQFLGTQGQGQRAEELQIEAVALYKGLKGADDPWTSTSIGALSWVYFLQRRYDEAEKLGAEVAKVNEAVLGPDHPETVGCIGNLASIYYRQGKWRKAEALQVQVLEKSKAIWGMDHPNTLTIMQNLGRTLSHLGRSRESNRIVEYVLKTRKDQVGVGHPDTLGAMYSLALTYHEMGRDGEAIALMQSCVDGRKRVLGPDHPDTKRTVHYLEIWTGEERRRRESRWKADRTESLP